VIDLSELRLKAGLTQVQLAEVLATSQGQISRVEKQRDMLLSTLSAYLAALGVEAHVVVKVGDQILTYDLATVGGQQ
jgi:transcriptional regulator with XRE-family HTH domain